MTVHLIRCAAGVESIEALRERQAQRNRQFQRKKANKGIYRTYTRNAPKRIEELVDGGSIYWVVKRFVRVRQRILGFDRETDDEGRAYCMIRIEPELVLVEPRSFKPFQGWRYLKAEDAPADLKGSGADVEHLPPALAEELRALGLI
jgi:hypothetical protein